MILFPDKGAGVVPMNTPDYIAKMKSNLSNQAIFKVDKLNKDLKDSTEKRISNLLRDLLKEELIDNKA